MHSASRHTSHFSSDPSLSHDITFKAKPAPVQSQISTTSNHATTESFLPAVAQSRQVRFVRCVGRSPDPATSESASNRQQWPERSRGKVMQSLPPPPLLHTGLCAPSRDYKGGISVAGRGQGWGRGGSAAGLISGGVGRGEGRGAYGVGLVRHLLSFNGCSVRGEKQCQRCTDRWDMQMWAVIFRCGCSEPGISAASPAALWRTMTLI